jgi:hypothetical protein
MLSRLTLPCAGLLIFILQPAAYSDVACDDIATVDLANSTLPVPGEEPLTFSNGVACPPDYDSEPRCEWKAEIYLDLLTTPEAGTRVRILDIAELHMRGSGASGGWSRLIAYRCDHGRLVAAFAERFEECGASVVQAFGPRLLLSVPAGEPKDGYGCGARSATKLYTWSPQRHTYQLDPISGGKPDNPLADDVKAGALLPSNDLPPR